MISSTRRIPAGGIFNLPWLHWSILASAIAAGTIGNRAEAQTFVLYDPSISSSPQTVTSAPLSDLLVPGSYIRDNGAEFSNFSFSAAASGAGAVTPSASLITIVAPTSAVPQLKFMGGPFMALGDQLVDGSLQFDVTEMDPMQKIMTAELSYTGAPSGTGRTDISETIDDTNGNTLGFGNYALEAGFAGNSHNGSITLSTPENEIEVSKDILAYGIANTDSGNISDFTQTFEPVPPVAEPSSVLMAVLASGGFGWVGWRRRKKRRGAAADAPTANNTPESAAGIVSAGLLRQTIAGNALLPSPA